MLCYAYAYAMLIYTDQDELNGMVVILEMFSLIFPVFAIVFSSYSSLVDHYTIRETRYTSFWGRIFNLEKLILVLNVTSISRIKWRHRIQYLWIESKDRKINVHITRINVLIVMFVHIYYNPGGTFEVDNRRLRRFSN